MTCQHCCGADKIFDTKSARKELKKYKKSGPKGITKELLEHVFEENMAGKTLLDIGGGIGVLQWAFLERNGAKTTDVDASDGYLDVAREFGASQGWSDQISFYKGDFADIADSMDQYDYVTLDKVVCCYPDYRELLSKAVGKSTHRLGMSFPIGGWISVFLSNISGLYMAIKRNPFRVYIHSKNNIHSLMTEQGFERIHSSVKFPFRVWVYEKENFE